MSNINKILITVVICVFMICTATVSVVKIVTSDKNDTTTTTLAPAIGQTDANGTTASAPADTATTEKSEASTTTESTTATTQSSSVLSTQTTAATTSPAVSGDLVTDILGKWMDSAGMSGFEFMEGGRVSCTYVDLAQFGVPFDGKATGLYTLEGDTLTIKFSIYTATIKKVYRASISGNELSLYDLEEHETSTYARVS